MTSVFSTYDLIHDQQTVSRGDHQLILHTEAIQPWALRHIAWGIRRGFDRLDSDYDVTLERKQTTKARNVYEVVSPYGTRIPKLVSTIGKRMFEELTSEELVFEPLVEGYGFVFRELDKRGVHLLTHSDLLQMPFDRKNVISCAHYALFNSGIRPKTTQDGVRFESTDGHVCGLIALFPDFVYDLAAEGAFAEVPDENSVVVNRKFDDSIDRSLFWCDVVFKLENGKREPMSSSTRSTELEWERL